MITIGVAGFLAIIVLVCLGVPLAFAIGLIAVAGNAFLLGFEQSGIQLYQALFSSTTEFVLLSIPLFIFMGQLVSIGGLGRDLYAFIHRCTGWLPGGLAVSTVLSCAGFGALTGVSAAGIGTLGPIALPEMRRYGYNNAIAAGSLASASTLAILIPPSIAFIVYGVWTETSIGQLFIAGIIPGLILTTLFSAYVIVVCVLRPSLAPPVTEKDATPILQVALRVVPIVSIFLIIMCGLYFGWFTPSEGAAIGCVVVMIVLALRGRLSVAGIRKASVTAARISIMIFMIVAVVQSFSRFLVLTDVPYQLVSLLTDANLNRYLVISIVLVAYLFLGMVLDTIGMMLLTLPFVFPVVSALGFDPVWFGVVLVIMIEVGLLTPPVGLNCYMLNQLSPDHTLKEIFVGVSPFVVICLAFVAILTVFPSLALWLPRTAFN